MEKFLVVEVLNPVPVEMKGVSSKTNKDYHIRYQDGVMFIGLPYPVPFRVNLEPSQPAYEAGKYLVLPDSFEFNSQAGRVDFKRVLKLQSIPAHGAQNQPKAA